MQQAIQHHPPPIYPTGPREGIWHEDWVPTCQPKTNNAKEKGTFLAWEKCGQERDGRCTEVSEHVVSLVVRGKDWKESEEVYLGKPGQCPPVWSVSSSGRVGGKTWFSFDLPYVVIR